MNKKIGWMNYKWKNIKDINISIRDRGVKFSDGLFETILVKNNKPIFLNEHLIRFEKSLNILNFCSEIDHAFTSEIINKGINKLNLKNKEYGSIRINYSRGLNIERSIKINELNTYFDPKNLWIEFYSIKINSNNIIVNICQTEKRNEFSLVSKFKTFNYNQSIQALIEAKQKKFEDSLLLNTQNELCCGTTFNILLQRNNEWLTPRKESGCLRGIMIQKLLDLNLVKEAKLMPIFKKDDVLIAINSLSCKQIKKVDDLEFNKDFDTNYFWDILCP
tara:strand:+ start:372 stop:1199 length:828 start_codon:yes stop_codon:yes gene_type:complete